MAQRDPPLDATIQVITPENIAFEYRLAGPFRRLPAFILDFCVGTLIFMILAFVINMTIAIASPIAIWWQSKLGIGQMKEPAPASASQSDRLASASRRSVTRRPVTR